MLSILIPAFNEEANIEDTIVTVLKAASSCDNLQIEIIIINDGSTDKTKQIIDKLAFVFPCIKPIHRSKNYGIGDGFRLGLKTAKYSKFMIVPGDDDMPSDLLISMMRNVTTSDIVLGYWLNREVRGRRRNILSLIYNTIYMLSFNIFIQYLNGPTIYPTKKLRCLNLKSTRFSITAEATIKAMRTGSTFCEIGGYMQTGLRGSTSFQIHNLIETLVTFLRLVVEIHVTHRRDFFYRPKRIKI